MIHGIEGHSSLNPTRSSYPGALAQPVASNQPMRILPTKDGHEHNIWRDTSLRYIGYADEIGEAVEPYIGRKAVKATYWISAVYAALDAFSTSRKAWCDASLKTPWKRMKDTLAEIGDAILFHVPATIFVPAFLIGKSREMANYIASRGVPTLDHHGKAQPWSPVVRLFEKPLNKLADYAHRNPQRSAMLIKRAPLLAAMVGIGLIPVFGHPVDKAINRILDLTYRKWVGKTAPQGQTFDIPELHPVSQPPSLIKPPDTFETLFR